MRATQKEFTVSMFDDYKISLVRALNFYNPFDITDKKKWALAYIKEKQYQIRNLDTCPDDEFRQIGTLAHIHSAVMSLCDSDLIRLDNLIKALQEKRRPKKREEAPAPKTIITDRVESLIDKLDCYMDGLLAGNKDSLDITKHFPSDIKAVDIKRLIEYISPTVNDFKSDDVDELYRQPKRQLSFIRKQLLELHESLLKSLQEKKAERKPRTKKEKPPSALVQLLSYMKEYPPLGLVSISPANIINADVLVTYDTGKQKLTVFYGADKASLSVHRSAIIGFDVKRSQMKTLRNPGDIKKFLAATRSVIKKEFEGISSISRDVTGRINDKTILVAVLK